MILEIAWMCDEGRLPDAGGVLDQDYGMMMQMRQAQNIYRALTRFRALKGENIHQMTDAERRIIRVLREKGLI